MSIKSKAISLGVCLLCVALLCGCNTQKTDFLGTDANFGVRFPNDCQIVTSVSQGFGRQHYDIVQLYREEGFAELFHYNAMDTNAEEEIKAISQQLSKLLDQQYHDPEMAKKATEMIPDLSGNIVFVKFDTLDNDRSYAYLLYDLSNPQIAYYLCWLR